jgi:RHS repeat-associated protein
MGNPTSYRGYTFTWRGKQLIGASNSSVSVSFEYNEDGLRQKKTVNNVDTDYFYNGSVLIGMQRGTSKFLFSYDASGNVVSVNYNGTEYYYLRNAQGDIVKLIDASGATMVEYTYDTWGKKVTTTGSLAGTLGLLQPFRYRGYVYDWELGLYYLQSRYYDPAVGRFISADVLLSTGQGVLGHNCYAYCLDNPVNMVDDGGNRPAKGMNNPDGDDEESDGDTCYEMTIALSVPLYGKPNSVVDRGHGQWRSYDEKGRAYEDYDRPHGGHNYWHKHKWKWNDNDDDIPERGDPERVDIQYPTTNSNDSRSVNWGAVIVGGLCLIVLIADDALGFGVADDEFIPVAFSIIVSGLA